MNFPNGVSTNPSLLKVGERDGIVDLSYVTTRGGQGSQSASGQAITKSGFLFVRNALVTGL
ncbi:MAG TPA: hypothetical protein VGM97_01430, partial [Steroidobacteraceae bacterium]